jgi:hypothetical protein
MCAPTINLTLPATCQVFLASAPRAKITFVSATCIQHRTVVIHFKFGSWVLTRKRRRKSAVSLSSRTYRTPLIISTTMNFTRSRFRKFSKP